MMRRAIFLICLLLFSLTVCCQNPTMSTITTPARAAEIRVKYSSGAIVRDMDHIRQDLHQVIQLSGDGTFTIEESIFYLMRMHDFDDNNQLDGLEMMRAFTHAHEGHKQGENEDNPHPLLETLVQLVDDTMRHDSNMDGHLSFAEWLQGYKSGGSA
ncbi:multiple coagulation factor deficiency protein 2-like [Varroa jacobsoni]|uniref:multiple coagulation factor deficiency protein 2-like n=1 Tax=Varroa jacobsoni TaxID=62625 RepID=UPI000BF771B6|nr:multiple coagulation factor deficiency protein 2-like [Varroa jacobsoni]